ncbi:MULTISPECIES: hypothetical protein [unclassified Sphingomonas]|uniref:hypothetical protein n=1 Tax=unclassified Sphingomonas TaxID=196159 RepID=UPI001F587823|nr:MULTISPECIES: hypothetical protein [unclassified Sphingomonas]
MQRHLSLPLSGSRHPFRQAVVAQRVARTRARDDSDVRLFVLSFSAFFVCFYTFIC